MPGCRCASSAIGRTTRCSSARRSSRRARRGLLDARSSPRSTRPAGRGNFLHLRGLAEDGPVHRGLAAARPGVDRLSRGPRLPRRATSRPQAYYEQAVRQKKRKELRRLRNRLAELGPVAFRSLDDAAQVDRLVRRLSRPGESRLEGRGGQRARLPRPRPRPSSAPRSAPPGTPAGCNSSASTSATRRSRCWSISSARPAASRSRPCSTRLMPASRPAC